MAITATLENRTTAYGKVAELLGLKLNEWGWAYLPVGTYFAGSVLQIKSETVQIMSDEWAQVSYAYVVLDDLTLYKFALGDGTDGAVDIEPGLKFAYETRQNRLKALSDAVKQAEYAVKQTTPVVQRGKPALVFKGRKIKPGTEVSVFWVGTQVNKWSGANETRAGVLLPDGSKVFCDAGNLQPLPTDAEISAYGEAQAALKAAQEAQAGVDAVAV